MLPQNDKPMSVREVAEEMGLSRQTVSRLFERERGVLVINRPETREKKRYRSIRIPRHVFNRVLQRLSI